MQGKKIRILALSGGGYRGLFTAKVLELLEQDVGCQLYEKFDLIAGTSIGGINALAIAAGIPAKNIVEFFNSEGKTIFRKSIFNFRGILKSKYSSIGLQQALERLFGDRKIEDLKSNVLIPSVNYTKGGPQVYKTSHHKSLTRDAQHSLIDVAMSTSAAPTYFPIHRAPFGDMVDGGLVANHPGLFAYVEARKFLNKKDEDISMLHIGTMSSRHTTSGASLKSGYGTQWGFGEKLFGLSLSCQAQAVDFILNFLISPRYLSIDKQASEKQAEQIGLDKWGATAQTILCQSATVSFQEAVNTYHSIFEKSEDLNATRK